MKIGRVLIIYKKSTYEIQAIEHKEPRFLKLLEEGHASVAKVVTAHTEHLQTLELIESALSQRGIESNKVTRADHHTMVSDYDLVVSVGGDGTFLDASHSVKNVPILGVNSSLSSSFGHFCLSNEKNFPSLLDAILTDEARPHPLLRLRLTLNGTPLQELVLNEVLVTHSNPAGTSRYLIEIEGVREEHKSSGIFIGPPPGSTGSIRSAGGDVLPITSSNYQFIVREPWTRPGQKFQFARGCLDRSIPMVIISQMRTGMLFIDGQHIEYPFPLGDELVISAAESDLMAFVDPDVNAQFVGD